MLKYLTLKNQGDLAVQVTDKGVAFSEILG